jgi:hypothetical protein
MSEKTPKKTSKKSEKSSGHSEEHAESHKKKSSKKPTDDAPEPTVKITKKATAKVEKCLSSAEIIVSELQGIRDRGTKKYDELDQLKVDLREIMKRVRNI